MTRPICHAYDRVCLAFQSPWQAASVSSDTPVLLGLSGGADSRLLLHLLAKICQKTGAELHVAHLHHGIRMRGSQMLKGFEVHAVAFKRIGNRCKICSYKNYVKRVKCKTYQN